jgi:hypothetical protein
MKPEKRHNLILSQWLIGLLLFISNITSTVADELKLQPFAANYSLHLAQKHVGQSTLSLKQSGGLWSWQTSAKTIGIYSWLSNKKPHSETHFSLNNDSYLIQNLLISDESDKNLYETAHFNWQKKQATILRKNLTSSVLISENVYDYNGINWLVANMMKSEKSEIEVDFYIKGTIVKSKIKRIDNETIDVPGKKISAWVYEQSTVNSKSKWRYYLNPAKPLAPLKIEKLKPGKKPAILLLESVVWS